ncbi:MAG: efflux RND transporter periplasmic adaptor subunit [Pseudomonadota bacterium]
MVDTAPIPQATRLLPEHTSDASEAEKQPNKPAREVSKRQKVVLYVLAACLVVIPILGVLFFTHHRHTREADQAQAAEAEQKKGPPLLLAKVTMTPPQRTVTLPADTRAVLSTTLYAKTSGFVVEMKTDKGFRCKKGDILAILQSPEVDQQVLAARADLDVKSRAATRSDELAKNGLVSEQDREAAVGNAQTSAAALRQMQVIKGYEQIRAPFDGVVTARYVDPGALVPAATGSTQAAMPVVDVAKIDTIRAVVYLGQDIASLVHEKDDVKLWQDEHPNAPWGAQITLLAGTLDPRTRTELAEIWFDNRQRGIVPGVYLHAEIQIKVDPTPLVPNDALITRNGKTLLAVIENNHVHLVPVTLGYSDGSNIQVVSGLKGTETVGMNVPPEVIEGSKVRGVPAPAQAPQANGI